MAGWSETRTFFREYRTNFKHTGAIMPSGRALGRALTRFVRQREGRASGLRILEVGPGTGAVTRQICHALADGDSLELVELNAAFVELLRKRLAEESPFCDVAARVQIHHAPIEAVAHAEPYDVIISGLPLNNFNVDEVEKVLGIFERMLAPGGTLSFFEYIGIRKLRGLVAGSACRARLRGIGRALDELLKRGEIHRDRVWPNLPPAYVHHVRLDGKS